MTIKALDLTGLAYFKSKLNIPDTASIQGMINTSLADYTPSVNLFTVVSTLPASGVEGRGYLVPNADDNSKYDLYTWENNAWVGNTGGSITITVDTALNANSNNPIANSAVTAALNGKAASSHTHGSITNDGKLGTASRVVITDSNKKINVSSVTSTELGYVAGVTSAIQTQLNSKLNSADLETITNAEIDGLFA